MDVNLPGINGLDATRQILSDARTRWSSCCSRPTRRRSTRPRAAECGASAYIPKAVFGPDRLESAWAAANEPAA